MSNENEEMIKRAVISGAAHALKYKEKNPGESDSEVLRQVMRDLREIIRGYRQGMKMGDLKEYQELCRRTAKKFETSEKEILTWGLGIAGEAGDVASCIKKTFAHDNDQRAGIRENIGDTLWYAAMICNFFNWDMEEVLKENISKLKDRFPAGFTIDEARRDGTMIDWNKK